MNYLIPVLLYCVERFHKERSMSAVYYLLKGKKSAQTIQDAVWYGMKKLFSVYPGLSREDFQKAVALAEQKKWITITGQVAGITEAGRKVSADLFNRYPLPGHLDGWTYHDTDNLFWQRLSLIVQTISNWANDETRFFPVQRDYLIQNWVKNWFRKIRLKYTKQQLADAFYEELYRLFAEMESEELDPNIIVYRLTGHKKPGLTPVQIANLYAWDYVYYYFLFRSYIHFIIRKLRLEKQQYPLLYSLARIEHPRHFLTKSGMKTYQYLKMGYSIEKISRLRKLKRNTIEDHIVEIAITDPNFSIDPYVLPELQQKINQTAYRLKTRKLKKIKEALPEADYFSIRLVLSKMEQ